jgi:glycogen synthase
VKVLQLIYESRASPFGFGGAGVRAREIYRRLADRHDIDLLCMRYPGARDEQQRGLRHIFVGTESRRLTPSVAAYTVQASAFVKRFGDRYDVIVENFLPSTPFFATLLTRTPVVLQIQGVMQRHALRKFPPYYGGPLYVMERFYPRLYDKLLFVSETTKTRVLGRHHRRLALCEVIPNGVAAELFEQEGGEDDYILFLSRIDTYTKGLDVLLKAFAILSRLAPSVRLRLAGFAADDVRGLLARLPDDIRSRVDYVGFVEGSRKTALLARAKFLVLPSRHESAPICIVEAAACGKPLIVSDIPELEFVQDRGMGLAFPSGSAADLAARMETLLTNENLRTTMGRAARGWAAGHLWENIAISFEKAVLRVAAGM